MKKTLFIVMALALNIAVFATDPELEIRDVRNKLLRLSVQEKSYNYKIQKLKQIYSSYLNEAKRIESIIDSDSAKNNYKEGSSNATLSKASIAANNTALRMKMKKYKSMASNCAAMIKSELRKLKEIQKKKASYQKDLDKYQSRTEASQPYRIQRSGETPKAKMSPKDILKSKLGKLDALFKEGVITEEEHKKKRAELIEKYL
jgi:hypothetical protein